MSLIFASAELPETACKKSAEGSAEAIPELKLTCGN
jgi:hypothetical protein